jgi:hypothetical protein
MAVILSEAFDQQIGDPHARTAYHADAMTTCGKP